MKGTLIVMSGRGNDTLPWDTEDVPSVEEAKEKYRELVEEGGRDALDTSERDETGKPVAKQMTKPPLTQEGEEVTVIARMAGG